jgi:hypothetical protein
LLALEKPSPRLRVRYHLIIGNQYFFETAPLTVLLDDSGPLVTTVIQKQRGREKDSKARSTDDLVLQELIVFQEALELFLTLGTPPAHVGFKLHNHVRRIGLMVLFWIYSTLELTAETADLLPSRWRKQMIS